MFPLCDSEQKKLAATMYRFKHKLLAQSKFQSTSLKILTNHSEKGQHFKETKPSPKIWITAHILLTGDK